MNYKYRITLAGIKGFFRLYSVNGNNSLYTFHKQIRSDLEFPADQPILFKALDAGGNVVARYALLSDLGAGTVDNVSIDKCIKAGAVSFVYFYDIAARKSVIINLEGEDEGKNTLPLLLETKGPVPLEFENGYVAFEDMPENPRKLHQANPSDPDDEDDDDEDDEEEDDDEEKEEEDIIYDENE